MLYMRYLTLYTAALYGYKALSIKCDATISNSDHNSLQNF